MNIKEEIQKLIDLQKIDSQLLNLKKERDEEKPKKITELKNNLDSKKSALSSLEEAFKKIQVNKKKMELDLETKEEAVRKAQAQLYQLKTNQEYKAKLKEIGSLKADVSVIEEDIIKILDEIDEKRKELDDNKRRVQEEEKRFKENTQKIEEEINQLNIKIKNLEDKRKIFAQQVEPSILSRYEHLLKNRGGLALVPLKGGSCGGCFMKLPPEVTNKVKHYSEIVQCEMCARLLYLEEDFQV